MTNQKDFDITKPFTSTREATDQLRAEIERVSQTSDMRQRAMASLADELYRKDPYIKQLELALESERAKSKALQEIMENNQRTIAVMENDLFCLGVNFDYAKVDERWKTLKESGDE